MKKRIGIVGFGTIGKYLYNALAGDAVEVVFIYDKQPVADQGIKAVVTDSPARVAELCAQGVDLVIESATAQAVTELAPLVLLHADMVVFSSTSFADEAFHRQAEQLCQSSGHRIFVPHGAVLGFDGLSDGKEVLEDVVITTTKRPENLGRTDKEKTVLYDGPTRGACKAYPRNVNVHAGFALAGLGFDRTRSRIVSDPDSPGNMHRIEIKAKGCRFNIDVLSDPISGVTGAYTPVSACASIRRILFGDGIVVM